MFNRWVMVCLVLGTSATWFVQAEDEVTRDAAQIVGEV